MRRVCVYFSPYFSMIQWRLVTLRTQRNSHFCFTNCKCNWITNNYIKNFKNRRRTRSIITWYGDQTTEQFSEQLTMKAFVKGLQPSRLSNVVFQAFLRNFVSSGYSARGFYKHRRKEYDHPPFSYLTPFLNYDSIRKSSKTSPKQSVNQVIHSPNQFAIS